MNASTWNEFVPPSVASTFPLLLCLATKHPKSGSTLSLSLSLSKIKSDYIHTNVGDVGDL